MSEAEALSPQENLEPAKGLDAIISGALDEAKYGEESVAAPETEKTAEELKIDATGRAHAADGKFAPKVSAEAKPSEPEPATAEAPPPAPLEPVPAEKQPDWVHPKWTEERKAAFLALPPEARAFVQERHSEMEADYTRKRQSEVETLRAFEPVQSEFQKLNPLLQHIGQTPAQFIAEAGNVASNLLSGSAEQRASAIAYLVQHRNIPVAEVLRQLGVPLSQAGPDGQMTADPAITQLHQIINEQGRKLQQIEQRDREREQQSKNQETERAHVEFNALGKATDQSGALKYPHFSQVNNTMIQLVASGQADTWDAAYTKAVRLDDGLYQQTVEAERNRVLQEQEKQRLEAVEKAKKAGHVKSSDGSPKGGAKLTGIDAHLGAAMERFGVN